MLEPGDKAPAFTLEDQNGNTIVLDKDGITLKSGKKAVTVKATTDFKAEGANAEISATSGVKVKGSGTAEISSSGSTTVKGSMVMIN